MPNKYVNFVSDKHFLECVKNVCEGYPGDEKEVELTKHTLDIVKMIFDMENHKINVDEWIKTEKMRQTDKTVNNKIGIFHQKLLGGVKGWEDLGTGNPLGVDLKKMDNSVFVELKNRYNTVKGEDLKHVFDKLKKVADKYPKAIVYYAYIIPKKPGSGEKVWKTSQREPNDKIIEVWGYRIYEIVTGDKKALKKMWDALPIVIEKVLEKKSAIQKKDMKKLVEFFQQTFH